MSIISINQQKRENRINLIKEKIKSYDNVKCRLDYKILHHDIIIIDFSGEICEGEGLGECFNYYFLTIEYHNKENAIKDFKEFKKLFKELNFVNILK